MISNLTAAVVEIPMGATVCPYIFDFLNKFMNIFVDVGPHIACCYKALCSVNTRV